MKREKMDNETKVKAIKLSKLIKHIAIKDLSIPDVKIEVTDIGRTYGKLDIKEKKIYLSETITDINVFIDCIFHELRHVYQMIYNKSIFADYKIATCKDNYDYYFNHPAEVDARDYAISAMEKYRSEISKIKYSYRRNQL